MKLLTKKIIEALPPIRSTENIPLEKQIVICKFFTPDSNWTWFVFEGEEIEGGDFEFWGMVHGFEKEIGYFRLSELEQIRGPWGLPAERDKWVIRVPYSSLVN